MVDAGDLKSPAARRPGSIPGSGTTAAWDATKLLPGGLGSVRKQTRHSHRPELGAEVAMTGVVIASAGANPPTGTLRLVRSCLITRG